MSKSKTKIITISSLLVVVALVLVAFVIFGSKTKSESSTTYTPSAKIKQKVSLVFDDEFNGSSLDKTKWNTCYDSYSTTYSGCSNLGNNEDEWYKSSQVSVHDGSLVLSAKRQTTQGVDNNGNTKDYAYTSGMVTSGRFTKETPEKWSGTYGFYEAKLYAPSGQAVWPAFWLLPLNRSWPPEIDVMEILGQNPNQVLTTYFWKDVNGNSAKDSSLYTSPTSLSNNWHIYAVNWQKGSLDWYLDGKLIKHVSSSNVSNEAMYVVLNLAMGGTLPGNVTADTPNSSTMKVDYVRIFQ